MHHGWHSDPPSAECQESPAVLYYGLKWELFISWQPSFFLYCPEPVFVGIGELQYAAKQGGLRMILNSNGCSPWSLQLLIKWIPSCCNWLTRDRYLKLLRQYWPHFWPEAMNSVIGCLSNFFMYTWLDASFEHQHVKARTIIKNVQKERKVYAPQI